MKKCQLREVLTVMSIAIIAAAFGLKIVCAILMGATIGIIYFTRWDD